MKLNNNSKVFIGILGILFLISFVSATDTQIWQGKYLTGNSSTAYTFNFTIYDSLSGENICYSNTTSLTTNSDKWWDTYQYNVASACSNSSIDYYLNINIDSVDQDPRRFLKQLKYADTSGDVEISGNLHMGGAITHDSPVLLRDGLEIVNANSSGGFNEYFHMFFSDDEEIAKVTHTGLTDATNSSLIFFSHNLANPYGMGYLFYDTLSNRSAFVISQGGSQRASTFDRSLMIGKSLGNASMDENYTLCQGFNGADCNTTGTGADLVVEDDIEAKGSIYSQENFNATGNLSLGQKITFAFGEILDNIVDGWVTITGALKVSGDFAVNNTNLYVNTSSGNVGIGTATPDNILHLKANNAGMKFEDDSGNNATINVGNSQLTLEADPENAVASTDIVFKMDGSEVARFLQGGDFGIGTSNPTDKLNVIGNSNITGYTMLGSDSPKIKYKKFSGTMGAGTQTSFASGVDALRVLDVSCRLNGGGAVYYFQGDPATNGFHVEMNGASVFITTESGSNLVNNPYECLMTYEE